MSKDFNRKSETLKLLQENGETVQELSGKDQKVLFHVRQQDVLLREKWTGTQDQALWRRAGAQYVTFKQILILLFTPVSVWGYVRVSIRGNQRYLTPLELSWCYRQQ